MNERIRDLFAVEPADFVRARDALAKELRAARREAEAKEAAGLRRPTAAVWAVNQLARKNRADLEEFIAASERVRQAQLRGASGDDLRTAMAGQRAALTRLEQAAGERLRSAGAQASPGALRAVQSTLQAAGSSPGDLRERLLQGTLLEALEPAGFDALLAAGPVRAGSRAADGGSKPPQRGSSADEGRLGRKAEQKAKTDRRAAEREVKRQLAEARKRAREARAAEKRLWTLERRARSAEAAAQQARKALEEARAALERRRN